MNKALNGKIALVTGAGSGIGHASALAFARAGATVVVSDVLLERCESVVSEITREGGNASARQCDVRDPQQINALFQTVLESYGQLDCAFNNAGVGGPITPLAEYPDDAWSEVIGTNLASVFHCMKHEIQQMVKQGAGSIVNCASVTGLNGMRGMPVYSASKHGILGLTKSAALDYAQQGVRINAVCPGVIHTPAVDEWMEKDPDGAKQFMQEMTAREPIGRLGTPDEVANAVVWLCSPGASFMIGHGLAVDGGYTAQ
jgi:NAD(P)-dependent dehydrogenase (short-subunit alcohol dehydrogenase family)